MSTKLNWNAKGFMARLKEAFKEMKAAGLIARQNFSCCGGCAGYEIATDVKENAKLAEKTKGAVFYTTQSRGNFYDAIETYERRLSRNRGAKSEVRPSMYLHFGDVTVTYEDKTKKTFGLPTVEVGKIVTAALAKHGIEYHWSGSEDEGIEIVYRSESTVAPYRISAIA
jgi:hypothetical protein